MTATYQPAQPANAAAAWTPQHIPQHNGKPNPPSREFFCPPPPEIGEIRSAFSTLPMGREPSVVRSQLLGLVVAAPFALVAWIVGRIIDDGPGSTNEWSIYLPALVVVLTSALFFLIKTFRHTCSYIGTDGIAICRLVGSRDNVRQQVLRFADAFELRAGQTRQHYNGVYIGTSYDFRWFDDNGALLLKLKGSYYSRKGDPRAKNPFHIAAAGEQAWTEFCLPRALAAVQRDGATQFNLRGGRWVRVGAGFLEFKLKREPQRLELADMKDMTISDGSIRFIHKDAGFFGSSGKYTIEYASLGNALLFLRLLATVFAPEPESPQGPAAPALSHR